MNGASSLVGDEYEVDRLSDFEVHQAVGMIMAQLEIGVAAAVAELCTHARRSRRPVTDVAQDVVDRTLMFSLE